VAVSKKLQEKLPISDGVLKSLRFLDYERNDVPEDFVVNFARALLFSDDDCSTVVTEWRHYKVLKNVSFPKLSNVL
jgi:uncharacterized protein YbaA (DUF1428 family)